MNVVQFLAAPFVMCLVMAGIHCYLGLHVLARGVVFVDLSLAQVATLGAAVAIFMGVAPHSPAHYAFALAATLLASLLFAFSRRLEKRISQEALIGIVYAFASAAVVLVLDRTPHGAEELKAALVGQILWVTWSDVLKTALIYILVGSVHFFYRRQLIASSFKPGSRSWKTDLLFYGTFGLVITSSTQYAGVLLVFSLLIVPAVLGNLFLKTFRGQLLFGWAFGALLSLLGVYLSYIFDTPVGAFIVILFTLIPILVVTALSVLKKD
ncbi:MAG: metal ABC transporter permease [Bdellovibrionales bacterium]